jgi:hypothetical protein
MAALRSAFMHSDSHMCDRLPRDYFVPSELNSRAIRHEANPHLSIKGRRLVDLRVADIGEQPCRSSNHMKEPADPSRVTTGSCRAGTSGSGCSCSSCGFMLPEDANPRNARTPPPKGRRKAGPQVSLVY